MTILRSGTSAKYADNWEKAFGAKQKKKAAPKKQAAAKKQAAPKKKAKHKKKG